MVAPTAPGKAVIVAGRVPNQPFRQGVERIVELLVAQGQLLDIVGALGAAGRLARRLNCRQQQRHQDADDGDHHQKFDERETS